ncbi:MAG: hypothetical protein EBR67_00825, partial [Proteobacteria bacterium]|nr:hypothetical protein [Pseudomonadota bacterium]
MRAYQEAVALPRDYTIFLPPGEYDLNGKNLNLTANYVKIIGLSESKSDVLIYSSFSEKGKGVINQEAETIHLENLTVSNTITIDNPSQSQAVAELDDALSQAVFVNNKKQRSAFSNSFCPLFLIGQESEEDLYKKTFDLDDSIIFVKSTPMGKYRVLKKMDLTEEEKSQYDLSEFSSSSLPPEFNYKVWKHFEA